MMENEFDAAGFSEKLLGLIEAVVDKRVAPVKARIDKLEHAKAAANKALADLERKVAERD